jgi:hypothetical protein
MSVTQARTALTTDDCTKLIENRATTPYKNNLFPRSLSLYALSFSDLINLRSWNM